MSVFLKWGAAVLLGVVLCILLLAVVLPKMVDPNDYQDEVASLVHRTTGLTLAMNGPVNWSVFPWLGLSAEQLTILGTDGSDLGQLDRVEVSVKLLPLFRNKVEVKAALLNGLDIALVRDENGVGNWQPVVSEALAANEHTTEQTEVAKEPASKQSRGLPLLNIASLKATNMTISYDDRLTGNFYSITDASLNTTDIVNQQPFTINTEAVLSAEVPDITLHTDLMATVALNLDDKIYDIEQLVLTVRPIAKQAEAVTLKGDIHFQQMPMMAKGHLRVPYFNLKKFFDQMNMPLPAMKNNKVLTSFALTTDFESQGNSLMLPTLELTLDDFTLGGHIAIKDFTTQRVEFDLTGTGINLDHYQLAEKAQQAPADETTVKASQPAVSAERPLLPEVLLQEINLQGSLGLSSLTTSGLQFDQLTATVSAEQGVSTVDLKSEFYGGHIQLDSHIDVAEGEPELAVHGVLEKVNLNALSENFPVLSAVEGLANVNVDIKTRGRFQTTMTQHLNGSAGFDIQKGMFTKANFNKFVCEGIAKAKNKKLQTHEWGETTDFQDLSGTFIIREGVATNNNLMARLDSLNFKGDGKINSDQAHDRLPCWFEYPWHRGFRK